MLGEEKEKRVVQLWTPEEEEIVREQYLKGIEQRIIGEFLGRNNKQVCGKVKDLKERGILPRTQQYTTAGSARFSVGKKNSPKLLEEIISDDDYPDFFNLDMSVCTILTSKRNQCKYPTPLEQAPSAMMKVCGKLVHTKGTPWRKLKNEKCQWCLEHIGIVYNPPHSYSRRE